MAKWSEAIVSEEALNPTAGSKWAGPVISNTTPQINPESIIDDTKNSASIGAIARASLAPDDKVKVKRYAESFKQPETDFTITPEGDIIRKVPGTDTYAKVQASVTEATGPIDAAKRAMEWVASGAGPTIPAVASTAAMIPSVLAAPGTGGSSLLATVPLGMAGASAGEVMRQKLDAALAPEGQEANMDYENVAWQGVAGAAGPLGDKVIKVATPFVKEGIKAVGKAGMAETMGVIPEVAQAAVPETVSAKALGLSAAGLAALQSQAAKHRAELELLDMDLAAFREAGAPVDLSLGQKVGEYNLRQEERQMLRDPTTVNDVMDLRELQNKTQIPGAVRSVLDDIAPDKGQEAAIGSFRAGADAVMDVATKKRAETAEPFYKAAFKSNQSMQSSKLDDLLDTPEGKDAFKYAITRMQNRMRNAAKADPDLTEQMRELVARGEMKAVPGGVAPGLKLETLDLIKQGLWDNEEALRKKVLAGNARQGEVDEVASIRRAFTNELDRLDATANEAAQGLPILDMKAAMRRAGKLPPSQVDTILADVDDMIKDAGGAAEALDQYKFPKGLEDFYKAALSAAEDRAAGPPTTGGNGVGLYKKAREAFGDPSDDIDAMKDGGIGFIQRMTGQDRQNIITRVFKGGNLLPEEISRMREQFAIAGRLSDWNVGIRSFIEDQLSAAMKSTQTSDLSNVGGKMFQSFWGDPKQAAVMKAALGGEAEAVMKRWDSLGRVLGAAARQLAEGSPTPTDIGAATTLKRIATGLGVIFSPTRMTEEVLDSVTASRDAEAMRQFAKYALTPEGDKILRALYLQTPSSPKAQSLLAQMFVQSGIVMGVGAAARESKKDE